VCVCVCVRACVRVRVYACVRAFPGTRQSEPLHGSLVVRIRYLWNKQKYPSVPGLISRLNETGTQLILWEHPLLDGNAPCVSRAVHLTSSTGWPAVINL
jgi:hypothetical protein